MSKGKQRKSGRRPIKPQVRATSTATKRVPPSARPSGHLRAVTMLAERATQDREAVGALSMLRVLRETVSEWEREAVERARREGATWDSIGEAMGLRRQAVWVRYGQSS